MTVVGGRSDAFSLADRAIDQLAALDPCSATGWGVVGYDDRLTDFSPTGIEARRELVGALLAEARRLRAAGTVGPADAQALEVMTERLDNYAALVDSGDVLHQVDVLTAAPFAVRTAFELMAEDGEAVRARLAQVPEALAGWQQSLQEGADRGLTAAQRQVDAVAAQVRAIGEGWFTAYARGVDADDEQLRLRGERADAAFRATADWLQQGYRPRARERDAAGREAYLRAARAWLGCDLDPAETSSWGWEELRRLVAEAETVADEVLPGAGLRAAADHLNTDPQQQIHGTPALLGYLEGLVAEGWEHCGHDFAIDPRIRTCAVRLAGEGSAAAPYYTPPSEDLSRPGTTWYPTLGKETFPAWQLRSIWFHEAVPGHHLQLGTVMAQQESLSRFQRLQGWTSGYGEGWALYAERYMEESGAFPDPPSRLGFLSAQVMRAVRVVVDIGLHLELDIPADNGLGLPAGRWTPALARRALEEFALLAPEFAASEVNRYLGLPGQAISYKVGERVWLEERRAARERLGASFDLRDWHMTALRAGHMGLGPFRNLMSGYRR